MWPATTRNSAASPASISSTTLKQGNVVVFRGIPTVIDEERVTNFEKALEGSGVKVIDKQYANWNRDDAFRVMQDFLSKHPKIDAVWASDDDMALGIMEAIRQAKRDDIKFVLGGAGMKDMVKRVMDGDKMIPADVSYPPAMIATAMNVTAAQFFTNAPMRGTYVLNAQLITKDNAKDHYFPDFALLSRLDRSPCGRGSRRRGRAVPALRLHEGDGAPMKTMKGPALFLAQFAGDERTVQFPRRHLPLGRISRLQGRPDPDLGRAPVRPAESRRVRRLLRRGHGHRARSTGSQITELSTHLQGQFVAVHPAFDEAFDGFAAPEVRGSPQARTNGPSTRCCWRRRPRSGSASTRM